MEIQVFKFRGSAFQGLSVVSVSKASLRVGVLRRKGKRDLQ